MVNEGEKWRGKKAKQKDLERAPKSPPSSHLVSSILARGVGRIAQAPTEKLHKHETQPGETGAGAGDKRARRGSPVSPFPWGKFGSQRPPSAI